MDAIVGLLGALAGVVVGAILSELSIRRREREQNRSVRHQELARAVVSLFGATAELAGTVRHEDAIRALREAYVAFVSSYVAGPPPGIAAALDELEPALKETETILGRGQFLDAESLSMFDPRSEVARASQSNLTEKAALLQNALLAWARSTTARR